MVIIITIGLTTVDIGHLCMSHLQCLSTGHLSWVDTVAVPATEMGMAMGLVTVMDNRASV